MKRWSPATVSIVILLVLAILIPSAIAADITTGVNLSQQVSPPVANFTATPTSGIAPLTVTSSDNQTTMQTGVSQQESVSGLTVPAQGTAAARNSVPEKSAPVAGATAGELHAAPPNPEFISYMKEMKENPYDSRMQGGARHLGLIPSTLYRPDVRDVQMFGSSTGDRATSYNSTYDLRTYNKVSPVKNQNPWGTCWAFATYASLESTGMPATPTPDFSEKNLANLAGFDGIPESAGGNIQKSIAYLARWNGPVNEATDPYPSGAWTSSRAYPPVKHVQNVITFPGRTSRTDNDNIKGALTRWGAVYSSLFWYDAFENATYASYYQPASDPGVANGHAITIVGWDDNYAATNFTRTADGPGAWLIKNSWGSASGINGYWYVSYYDKTFGSVIYNTTTGTYKDTAVVLGESVSNYDTVYSYDRLGEVTDYWYGTAKTGSFANVFTANSSQTIKAVGLYTTDLNVPYTISIYKNPTSGPVDGGTLAATFSGTLPYKGYNTVVIPSEKQVSVTTGNIFSVVVQVTNPTNDWYIPVEMNSANYSSNVTSQPGQGYVLGGAGWIDWKTYLDNSNICLKAYTSRNTTIGMYRNGVYYLRNSNTAGNADLAFAYGSTGDIPVTGDWDGEGITTIGMYRGGTYYLRNSNTPGNADLAFAYGSAGDIPVTGDWDGDGITTIGMYRNGVYYLRNTNDAGNADLTFAYGSAWDIPVTGDWDGDGIDTIGMYRNGVYYLRNTNDAGNADMTFAYGSTGDTPVTGDWDGNGITTIGMYRNGVYYLRNSNTAGDADRTFAYGSPGDTPVTGDWI